MRRPRRRKVVSLEDLIQGSIIQLLRLRADPRTIYLSIPNGVPSKAWIIQGFVERGLLAGAADLLVISPDGVPHFVEVKTPVGIQTEIQRHFQARCKAIGVDYHLVRSSAAAEKLLASWGALRVRNDIRRAA